MVDAGDGFRPRLVQSIDRQYSHFALAVSVYGAVGLGLHIAGLRWDIPAILSSMILPGLLNFIDSRDCTIRRKLAELKSLHDEKYLDDMAYDREKDVLMKWRAQMVYGNKNPRNRRATATKTIKAE